MQVVRRKSIFLCSLLVSAVSILFLSACASGQPSWIDERTSELKAEMDSPKLPEDPLGICGAGAKLQSMSDTDYVYFASISSTTLSKMIGNLTRLRANIDKSGIGKSKYANLIDSLILSFSKKDYVSVQKLLLELKNMGFVGNIDTKCTDYFNWVNGADTTPFTSSDGPNPVGQTSNSGDTGKTVEEAVRSGLQEQCTNLPNRFKTMRFQAQGQTFNNYGQPLDLYSLGGTNLAVLDQGDTYRVGPADSGAVAYLNSWECLFPFDTSK